MGYDVQLSHRAGKEYLALRADIAKRVGERIDALSLDPRPHGCLSIQGLKGSYRLRAGDYRIVYVVDDPNQMVSVVRVGHRSDVYQGL